MYNGARRRFEIQPCGTLFTNKQKWGKSENGVYYFDRFTLHYIMVIKSHNQMIFLAYEWRCCYFCCIISSYQSYNNKSSLWIFAVHRENVWSIVGFAEMLKIEKYPLLFSGISKYSFALKKSTDTYVIAFVY